MLKKHHKLMWSFTRSAIKGLNRPVFIYLISMAITLQLLFAFIFLQVEGQMNPQVTTFFDALYYTVTVMTGVGLGDIHAITKLGRVVSMLMMLSGTVIFVTFTGVLSASILDIESRHLEKYKDE